MGRHGHGRSRPNHRHICIIVKLSGICSLHSESTVLWHIPYTFASDNKEASCYRYKVVKFWDSISLAYSKDRAAGEGARTTVESAAEMIAEDVSNSATTSSAQTGEELKKKRYRSDDSIASMLGDKLDKFTFAFIQDEAAQASNVATPEEILHVLNQIPGLEEDDMLAVYDILVSNDHKFKSLMALPERMKKRWVLKQVKP